MTPIELAEAKKRAFGKRVMAKQAEYTAAGRCRSHPDRPIAPGSKCHCEECRDAARARYHKKKLETAPEKAHS